MVQAFNIPTPTNYLGNAMAINRQNAQQDQQNALMQRDQAIQEQTFQNTQQDRQTAAEAAKKALKQQALLSAARALSRAPRAQRAALYQQSYINDQDWVNAVGQETANAPLQDDRLFDDFYLTATLNKENELTDAQKAAQSKQMKEAETVPTWEWVLGPNGQPMRRAINPFSAEAGQGVVGSADPNSIMTNNTSRANNAATNATSRANNISTNATSRANNDATVAASRANNRASLAGAAATTTAKGDLKSQSARTAATYYGQARDAFNSLRNTYQAGGPIQTAIGRVRQAIHPSERMAVAKFDAAIRALTPVLKNVIRGPGEGTWSDGDQAVLESILPNRSMGEAQIEESLRNVETLLRDNGAIIPESRAPGTTPGASGSWDAPADLPEGVVVRRKN